MSTSESKSISREVAGLFDKIREQAREYGRLMEELDALARHTAGEGERVREEFGRLRAESATTMQRVDDAARQALATVEHKASTLNALYEQLSTIEQTRTSLMELSGVLRTQKQEIEKIIKTSENQIRRIAEESYVAFETRVALQFQQIKDELRVLDNKLVGLLDLHRREMRQVQEDIDQFKSKVTETKYIVDETTKIVTTMIEEAEQRIDSRLLSAQIAIQHQVQEAALAQQELRHAESQHLSSGSGVGRRDIEQLRERVKHLEKNLAFSRSVSIGLGITALLLAAVAILV